jgi:hypothetical protein
MEDNEMEQQFLKRAFYHSCHHKYQSKRQSSFHPFLKSHARTAKGFGGGAHNLPSSKQTSCPC